MRTPRAALTAVALAVAVTASVPAWAGEAAQQLFERVDEVLKILEDPALKAADRSDARRAEIRRVARTMFDFEEIARRTLGQHWRARTPAQRSEFVRLFGELLERVWIGKIELYGGERVVRAGDAVDGDFAIVRSRIVTQQGTEIPVDYRMHRQGDSWRIYDVVIEGASLVANYRSQFDRVIRRGSFEQLVAQVRDKL